MPLRRSCFPDLSRAVFEEIQVSMPLRRSCFVVDVVACSGLLVAFQCHYGVPASLGFVDVQFVQKGVSMPLRRSCFADDQGL